MRRAGLIGSLSVIVAVNAFVLAGVAWNRSGVAQATLVLTERELPVAFGPVERMSGREENSGVAFSLVRAYTAGPAHWLDRDKLRELGFDPDNVGTRCEAIKRPLPRRAYVVLELDGPAWAAALARKAQEVADMPAQLAAGAVTQQQLENAQLQLERMRIADSRLLPVDAGPDAAALRAAYPDGGRYLITSATFHMNSYCRRGSGGSVPEVQGRIGEVLTSPIHVPARFHAALRAALERPRESEGPGVYARGHYYVPAPPRYAVTVHYGKRSEPWIAALEPIDGSAP